MSSPISRLIAATQRHHALEHATIHILNRRFPSLRVIGWSTNQGFYIHGPVSPASVGQAVAEAIARLRRGETHLAIHPRCGTNLVTSGTLVGAVAFLTMLPGTAKSRRERLPLVLLLSTLAMFLAQPLGLWVQANVTTSSDLDSDLVPEIDSRLVQGTTVHHVRLVHSAAN